MAGELVKAAAKLTGVPVIHGGIRGKAPEHLLASSSSCIPFSARPSVSVTTSVMEAAGDRGPMPRVVFHGEPTLEEAKEATSELILGIEKIYPWSCDYDGYELNSSVSRSQVEQAEASGSGSAEITTEPVEPTTALTAFRFLRENYEARNVVASLACDPNVLQAVRQNQQLQEFMNSERRRWALSRSVTGAERLDHEFYEENPSNDAESLPGIGFEDILKIIKDMVGMIKNVSDLFKNLFGRERAESSADGDHGTQGESAEHVVEASLLLGLAIMVIMIIFLKRG